MREFSSQQRFGACPRIFVTYGMGLALAGLLGLSGCGQAPSNTSDNQATSSNKAPSMSVEEDSPTSSTPSGSSDLTITEDDTNVWSGDIAGTWECAIVVADGDAAHAEEVLAAVPVLELNEDGTGTLSAKSSSTQLTWENRDKSSHIQCIQTNQNGDQHDISGTAGLTKSGMMLWHTDGEPEDTYTLWMPLGGASTKELDELDFSGTYDDPEPNVDAGAAAGDPTGNAISDQTNATASTPAYEKPAPVTDTVIGAWIKSSSMGTDPNEYTEVAIYPDGRLILMQGSKRIDGKWDTGTGNLDRATACTFYDASGAEIGGAQLQSDGKMSWYYAIGNSPAASMTYGVRQ